MEGNKSHKYKVLELEVFKNWERTCRKFYIVLLLSLLKKVGSARLRESDIHPISPKTQAPQYQPIDRKKRYGKE